MKKNLKQALVPLAVMVFGAAAAFATNAVKQSDENQALMWGFHYDNTKPVGQRCVTLQVDCNPYEGEICTIGGKTYYQSPSEVGGLQCSFELRKN